MCVCVCVCVCVCITSPVFICLLIGTGCLQILAAVNHAAMNIEVHGKKLFKHNPSHVLAGLFINNI